MFRSTSLQPVPRIAARMSSPLSSGRQPVSTSSPAFALELFPLRGEWRVSGTCRSSRSARTSPFLSLGVGPCRLVDPSSDGDKTGTLCGRCRR